MSVNWQKFLKNLLFFQVLGLIFTSGMSASENFSQEKSGQEMSPLEYDLRQQLQKRPSDHKLLYNLGVHLYQQQRYAEALSLFQQAASAGDERLKSQALYNQGMAELMLKQYSEALAAWRSALSYQLDDQQIAENLQWLERHLEQMESEQEKEQQQQQQQQSQNSDEQDSGEKNEKGEDQKLAEQDQQQGEPNQSEPESDQKPEESLSQQEQQNGESQQQEPEESTEQLTEQQSGSKDEQDRDASNEQGSDQQPTAEQDGKEEVILSAEQMELQDAEKLIRSVEDKIGRFHIQVDRETLRRRQGENGW